MSNEKMEPVFSPDEETPPEFKSRIEALDGLKEDPEAWVREALSIMEAAEPLEDMQMYLVVKPVFRVGFPSKGVTDPDLIPDSYKEPLDEAALQELLKTGLDVHTIIISSEIWDRLAARLGEMPEVMGDETAPEEESDE